MFGHPLGFTPILAGSKPRIPKIFRQEDENMNCLRAFWQEATPAGSNKNFWLKRDSDGCRK